MAAMSLAILASEPMPTGPRNSNVPAPKPRRVLTRDEYALQREIAEWNAEVDARKAAKRAKGGGNG
jgi:hypothetical protein